MAKIKVSEMHDGTRILLGRVRILIKGEPHKTDDGNYAVTMIDLDMSPGQKPFTAFLQGHTKFEVMV